MSNITGIKWHKANLITDNGVIDIDASLKVMKEELIEYVASSIVDNAGVAEAVASIFDRMPAAESKLIDINSLALKAFGMLNVPAGKETKALEAIKSYIRSESKLFESSSGEAGKYWVVRGTGCYQSSPATIEKFKALKARKNQVEV